MKVNVKRIPADGETLVGDDPPAIMEMDEPDIRFQYPVHYELLAQIQGNALLVTGGVQTLGTLRCARCLREFEQPLRVEQFVAHEELKGEDFVDLTPQMREDIILELPQRALCHEACKGLCPRCGIDLNSGSCRCDAVAGDLRWQSLDKLKKL